METHSLSKSFDLAATTHSKHCFFREGIEVLLLRECSVHVLADKLKTFEVKACWFEKRWKMELKVIIESRS